MDCRYPDHKDVNRLDTTTEQDIAMQQHMDEADAMLDAAKYARRVRKRLGLS
jgi:putative transcriptional regulator